MDSPEPWAVRVSRRTVARWFCGREPRRFVPSSGASLPVGQADELAVTAAAEMAVARRFEQLNERIAALFLLIVGVLTCYAFLGEERFGDVVSTEQVFMGSLLVAIVALTTVTWRYERALLDLREAIAFSLRERYPDMGQRSDDRRFEPNLRKLAPWLYWGAILLVLSPLLSAVE